MPNKLLPGYLINETPATIRRAFEKADNICTANGDAGLINLSDIATKLIRDCGRFAEDYASDMLITWDNVRKLCGQQYQFPGDIDSVDEIFAFGIRKSGVDHNAFVMNRLNDTKDFAGYVHVNHVYRRILAVGIRITKNEGLPSHSITASLRDITNNIRCLDAADTNPNGSLISGPYPPGHGMPKDIKTLVQELKSVIPYSGPEAVKDVLGFECPYAAHDDDKENTIDSLLDEALGQMPEYGIRELHRKYCT